MTGLLDTSVLIALESGRPADLGRVPDEWRVSVITRAELYAGVLSADDTTTRVRRLNTLAWVDDMSPLPVDEAASVAWAELRVILRDAGRAMKVNDLWIAAIARSNELTIVTQDDDFDVLVDLGLVDVIKV